MSEYNREELIELSEKAVYIPASKWADENASSVEEKVRLCYSLLKSGAEFEINEDKTDDEFIHLEISHEGEVSSYCLPTRDKLHDPA